MSPSGPQILPSPPPSPPPLATPAIVVNGARNRDEDAGKAWHDDEEDAARERARARRASRRMSVKAKGKGKQRADAVEDDDEDEDEESEDEDVGVVEGYPPTKDEEAESRRVQENLRRWEVAERQRRKAARESVQGSSGGAGVTRSPSMLADLFHRDSRKAAIKGAGTHQVLADLDEPDGVPLDNLAAPPVHSPLASPSPLPAAGHSVSQSSGHGPSPYGIHGPVVEEPEEDDNPFDTPTASRTSLNLPRASAIMTETEQISTGSDDEVTTPTATTPPQLPTPPDASRDGTVNAKRPTLPPSGESNFVGHSKKRESMRKSMPPPPLPLGLPQPRELPKSGTTTTTEPEPILKKERNELPRLFGGGMNGCVGAERVQIAAEATRPVPQILSSKQPKQRML
ncbi:uncharacterized protein BXZ73DRAFT_98851 [Epithele typhae]|uniref:uncharacterized protein n=1 Tax=Epithele typhae TaxID=378194 RepID=UPI002007D53C|nr:uncharacterized protein BXZ73DRAFT_98851 [Epithele typhae]KAH9940415.1 hypothetical protein BXZ73DRAFT_98851 [Epithele typhae]